MTELEFEQLARQGYNRIPVVAEIRADLDTPVALYLKLAQRPYSYLLESVVGGERFGRYSYIGLPCSERIEGRGTQLRIVRRGADSDLRPHLHYLRAEAFYALGQPAEARRALAAALASAQAGNGDWRASAAALADRLGQTPTE